MAGMPESFKSNDLTASFKERTTTFIRARMTRGFLIKFIAIIIVIVLAVAIIILLNGNKRSAKKEEKKSMFTIQRIDKRFDGPMTWKEAERSCQSIGGHLPSLHHHLQNGELNDIMLKEHRIVPASFYKRQWLGGYRAKAGSNDQFIWSDGTAWNYENWLPSEPNTLDEECVEMVVGEIKSGFWNDADCTLKLEFICFINITIKYESGEGFKTWQDASTFCQNRGGHLPSIHNLEQSKQVLTMTEGSQWLGGRIIGAKQVFSWTDKSSHDFEGWDSDDPDRHYSPLDMCVTSGSRQPRVAWSYKPCYEKHAFSCAIPV